MNKELEIAYYFMPESCLKIPVTVTDEEKFLEFTSQGKHRDKVKLSGFDDGFNALVQGKRYAGITMGLWERGVLEGSTPYATILEDLPQPIKEFTSKEMFKGADRELIMSYAPFQDLTKTSSIT